MPRATVGSSGPNPAASRAINASAVGDGSGLLFPATFQVLPSSLERPGLNPQVPSAFWMPRSRTRSVATCFFIRPASFRASSGVVRCPL